MGSSNPFTLDSLDGQIWESLYYYPSLYRNGGEVLHHMYCVIGNGCEWNDGKLMHNFEDTDRRNCVFENPVDHKFSSDELAVRFEIDRLRRNHTIDFVRMHAKTLVGDRYREWSSLYPICEYSRLANVPDDAREDFLAGARLAIDLSYGALLKGGGLVSFQRGPSIGERRHDATRASIEVLDASLIGIIERFGTNPLGVEKTGHWLWGNFHEYVNFQRQFDNGVRELLSSIIPETRF